jgi:hypothetical protein
MWVLGGPALLGPLSAITITAGFVAFFVAKAKLPDRGWRSLQTFNILLTFAATIAAAGDCVAELRGAPAGRAGSNSAHMVHGHVVRRGMV